MSTEIKTAFLRDLPVTVDIPIAKALIKLVDTFETRGSNPLAFNTYSLGVYKCLFLTEDRDAFFNLFDMDYEQIRTIMKPLIGNNRVAGISMNDVQRLMKADNAQLERALKERGLTAADIRKVVNSTTVLNSNYKVATDPFNIFVVYVLYKISSSKIPANLKELAMFKTFMLLQYKFFTSLVNHRFPYQADESAMTLMYESLSNKFDLKTYGTWKKVMEARANLILNVSSVHERVLKDFEDDRAIIYFLSDSQTRIRNQINLIVAEFMKIKDERDIFGSYSSTGTDKEGEKVVLDNVSYFDMMCSNVYTDSLSVAKFLDDTAIKLIVNMFVNLNSTNFRNLLVNFSDRAVRDHKAGTGNKTISKGGRTYIVGTELLITTIIQKTYRFCMQNQIDYRKPVAVLKAAKDVYSSSRSTDEDILQIRDSMVDMVNELQSSRRESLLSALRIGFVLYILLLSFKYIK